MVGILTRPRTRPRTRRKGQALLEMALMSMFLALLLAGAVDFGRAFYTAVVVSNMAAEGAAYASLNPDRDLLDSSCSQFPVVANKNIQDRARLVAAERGLVIKREDRDAATIVITTPGYSNPTRCDNRCLGRSINVEVTYVINDLFLPNLLGMRNITIKRSATQQIQRDAYAASCP